MIYKFAAFSIQYLSHCEQMWFKSMLIVCGDAALGALVERRCLSSMDVPMTTDTFVPLNQIAVSSDNDFGALAIKVIKLLQRTHSDELAPSSICIDSLSISSSFGYLLLCSPVTLADTRLKIQNIIQALDVLELIVARNDIEYPKELKVVELMVRKRDKVDYGEYIRVFSRLLLLDEKHQLVQRYYKLLTIEELLLLQGGPIESCVPHLIKLVGSRTRFVEVSSVRQGSCMRSVRISVSGRSIALKTCKDLSVVRESSIMSLLEGIPRVVRRFVLDSRHHECRASVLVTQNQWWRVPLSAMSKQSLEWVREFALHGITFIEAIHGSGFIHGSITEDSFLINGLTRDPSGFAVVGWHNAQPWNSSITTRTDQDETLHVKSVFELEGDAPSRRDDLYRFSEILLRLIGEPEFSGLAIPSSMSSLAMSKRKRKFGVLNPAPACFVAMYTIVEGLDKHEDPNYRKLIECFSNMNIVRV